jgi:4-amino-4-deoxy-L-arabinose transferase-like glycosyltransferase
VLLLALLVWGGQYARRDLWEPDEARYAYVAAEMQAEKAWLVPIRHGEIYSHKPPLMFWLIRAGAALGGDAVGRWAARGPSLLGAVLALLAASRLCHRWCGVAASWRVLPVLAGSFLFWQTAGMGQIDALLLGLEMSALWALFAWNVRAAQPGARHDTRPLLAGLALGLAVLAKGPVGLVVPLGVYVAGSWAAGERRALGALPWTRVAGLALLPVLGWLAACRVAGAPESYFRELIFSQNVERAAGAWGHVRSAGYFLWHAPIELLPWTLFVPAAWMALGDDPGRRVLRRRLAAWMLFVLLFFSLPASKRNLYVLLVHPAAAMLVAAAWERIEGQRFTRFACAAVFVLLAAVLVAAAASLPFVALPVALRRADLVPALIALAVPVAAGCLALRRPPPAAPVAAFAVVWLLVLATAGAWLLPAFNAIKTPVALATAAARHLPAGQRLIIYRVNGEILALYARARGWQVADLAGLRGAMRRQQRGLAVFERADWQRYAPVLEPLGEAQPFNMGHKSFVWFAFGPRNDPASGANGPPRVPRAGCAAGRNASVPDSVAPDGATN